MLEVLYTKVNKWVPANLLLGVTLRWTSILSRGEKKYSDTDSPLGSNADLSFLL